MYPDTFIDCRGITYFRARSYNTFGTLRRHSSETVPFCVLRRTGTGFKLERMRTKCGKNTLSASNRIYIHTIQSLQFRSARDNSHLAPVSRSHITPFAHRKRDRHSDFERATPRAPRLGPRTRRALPAAVWARIPPLEPPPHRPAITCHDVDGASLSMEYSSWWR